MMDNREFDLSISTYGVAKQLDVDVVILPWGATEPHNWHLPYMTDCILSQSIAIDAAKKAFENHQTRCMVLPPVTMGAQNPGQRTLPFCIHSRYETQKAILSDIVASLHIQGFRRLLIVNGHGGNVFKSMIRDLAVDYPDFFIAASEWFKQANPKDFFDKPDDHADELETSVMMYYHPEWVKLEEAGEGKSRKFSIDALQNGSIWLPRKWDEVSQDTGIGNPELATAEKGKLFAEAVTHAYATFLHQFSKVNAPADMYKD